MMCIKDIKTREVKKFFKYKTDQSLSNIIIIPVKMLIPELTRYKMKNNNYTKYKN